MGSRGGAVLHIVAGIFGDTVKIVSILLHQSFFVLR